MQNRLLEYKNMLINESDPERRADLWGLIGDYYFFELTVSLFEGRALMACKINATEAIRAYLHNLHMFPNNIYVRNRVAAIKLLIDPMPTNAMKYLLEVSDPIIRECRARVELSKHVINPDLIDQSEELNEININYNNANHMVAFHKMERLALMAIVDYLSGNVENAKIHFSNAYQRLEYRNIKKYSTLPMFVIRFLSTKINQHQQLQLNEMFLEFRGASEPEEAKKRIIREQYFNWMKNKEGS